MNGTKQSYGKHSAVIINGQTLVPVRETFTTLGANIIAGTPYTQVGVVKDRTSIWLTMNSKEIKVNGNTMELSHQLSSSTEGLGTHPFYC
jgi:ABC-type xylose transport system permease subunit